MIANRDMNPSKISLFASHETFSLRDRDVPQEFDAVLPPVQPSFHGVEFLEGFSRNAEVEAIVAIEDWDYLCSNALVH